MSLAGEDRRQYGETVEPSRDEIARRSPMRGAPYRLHAEPLVLTHSLLELLRDDDTINLPGKLYAAGDPSLLKGTKRVSIVGSRDASEDGKKRAAKLARQLAEAGVVVVSGLAKGIDFAAHSAALAAGGRTIAVIGTPLDKAYPHEHGPLQERIARDHLLISQFAEGTRVFPSNFVARNRVMALLSHASVIVEAGDTSGSLSQAAETQRGGRPLFFMQSVLERTDLKWPAKFRTAGAIVLQDVQQILEQLSCAPSVSSPSRST
jgi:DNA processing protein